MGVAGPRRRSARLGRHRLLGGFQHDAVRVPADRAHQRAGEDAMSSTVDDLVKLAGPLGPFGSMEENERLRAGLKAGDPLAAAQRILGAVASQPSLPLQVEKRAFEFEAAELLNDLAGDPRVRFELERALADKTSRPVALEAIALSADQQFGPALAA